MRRVTGLPDDQVVAWEEKLEAQVVASLQAVMDKIASRIERVLVASGLSTVERQERVASGADPLRGNAVRSLDRPQWPYPERGRALVAVATTGPTGDDDPPPMTGELAIPEPTPLPAVLPETPGLPPGQPYISPDDLASIAPLWQQAVAEQVLPLVAQVFVDSAGHVRSQFLDAVTPGVQLGLPGLGSVAAEAYLAQARNTYEQVGDHLWATARAQLSEGFDAGESIPQLAARLRQSAGLSARTAVMVARTSVIEASNAGSMTMARASKLEMLKEWIATPDRRTRPTHLAADGQRVPLSEPFIVGGYPADFPAAPTLPPSERYRCRCTQGYVMPDRQPDAQPGMAELPGTSTAPAIEAPEVEPEILAKATEPGEPGFDLADFPEPPPVKVRSSLLRARTDRELIAAWQGEMRAITGRDIIVQLPPDASVLTMREHAEGVLQMLERFPEARLRKISWYDQASTEYAHVKVGTATLEFNARWASTAQRRAYLASLRSDVAGWDDAAGPGYGWSVRGGRVPQATSWHEMAHILSIETLGGKLKAEAMRITLRRMAADALPDMESIVRRDVSGYATKNMEELIAEAMTDVMANGPRASLLSRELYDMVAREYRARGFAVRTVDIPEGEAGFEAFTREAFPKAAGPRALTTQTVAQLRALAKERGITVPAGTRKADLVRMLDEGAPPAPVPVPTPVGSAALPARVVAARAELDRVAGSPTTGEPRRMGGDSAYTFRERHEAGDIITKDTTRGTTGKAEAKRDADAEELGALVGDSLDLRVPAVVRTGPSTLRMEFIEGTEGGGQWRPGLPDFEDTDDGKLLGLLDILTGNPDRSGDNWLILPGGRIASIDMGSAFRAPKMTGAQHAFGARLQKASFDIAPADLALIRTRLEALRPEFERLKRGTWHNQMMARLAEVEKRATGTRSRLAEAAGDVVSPEARAVTRQAVIDERRAVADSLGEVRELLANGASERALASRARLIAGRTTGAASEDLAGVVRAMESGDADRIRVALGDVAQRRGLTEVGPGGDVVPFDPKIHELVGGARRPPAGTFVQVQRPGYSVRLDDGEIVQLSKAKVDTLTVEEIARLRAASLPRFDAALSGDEALAAALPRRALTKLEDDAVGEYGLEASFNINKALRESRGDVTRLTRAKHGPIVEGLDSAMEPLPSDVVSYRNLAGEHLFDEDVLTGDLTGVEFTDFGYVSTATVERRASSMVMRILAPKGTPAISGHGLETDEIVLGRGLTFRIVKDYGKPHGTVRQIDVEVVPVDRKALREAARERNRVIEAQRATAKLLAEVDELAAKGASKTAIRERLDPALREAGQAYAGADAAVVDTLSAALDSGDMAKIRAAVTRAGTKAKIKPIGRAGAKTTFDPDTMEGVGGIDIAPGAKVTVVRRGSTVPGLTDPLAKAQVTSVRAASTVKTVEKGDFTGLTKVGEQLGGNPGGIFEAGDGSRWYVKAATSPEHARSEALALDLYRAAGLDAPDLIVGTGVDGLGARQVATRFLDDARVDLLDALDANDVAYLDQVREGFATDAWLANWDVVGANPAPGRGWDNIISVAGKPVRIEAGAALRYRGLGGEKKFGDEAGEFDSLRDPAIGRRAAQVFGDMTPEQLIASAERIRKITPTKIKALVKKHDLDPDLADTLIARRADILRRAEALAGPKPMTTVREYEAAIKSAAKGQDALDAAPFSAADETLASLTSDQRLSLSRYRGGAHINEALRDAQKFGLKPSPNNLVDIHDVDQILDGSRLTRDAELWRAPGSGWEIFGGGAPRKPGELPNWGDNLTGFEWSDSAYSSTSASRRVADRFAVDGGVRLRILAPRGSKAIQLSNLDPLEGDVGVMLAEEAEILLARGARYRVVKDRGWTEITHPTTRQKIRVRDLDVEVIVPDETPPLPWDVAK